MKTLGAVLYENFELLDFYGPLEMFGNIGPDLKIVTIAEQSGAIKSAQGPSAIAEFNYSEHPELNFVLVPGGLGTFAQLNNPLVLDFIRRVSTTAEVLMSVCSGSALFAKAGVLDGKRATTNKMFFNLTTEQSDKVEWIENARWVEDDNIFTSSGVSAGIDMALSVISKIYGIDRAEKISMMTEYEWQADPSKDPFAKYLNTGDITEYLSIYSGKGDV
ncbi:MAG: DJ-1/PfpI family protein [Pseudomonadota bacterium]